MLALSFKVHQNSNDYTRICKRLVAGINRSGKLVWEKCGFRQRVSGVQNYYMVRTHNIQR